MMIKITEVSSGPDLDKFIRFPDRLYKGNPYRVPPLHSAERGTLNPRKNPAFEFCESKYWIAVANGKTVGRIAGIINHKSNEIHNEKYARLGWFDFIDDFDVSGKLLETLEEWAKSKGMTHICGPMGFSDLDIEGLLVEGFNEISTQAVMYNFPYYPVHFEKAGYVKEVDWIQYEITIPDQVPDKIKRIAGLVKQKYDLRVVKAKKAKDLLPYAGKMFDTVNESFKDLYGYVALTDKQKAYYTKLYFSFINPKFVCLILDKNDDVVGFGISLYSLSKALIKAKGKLFPFGFIHILRALQKNDTLDSLLQGVKPKFQNKGIPAIFFDEIMQAAIDNGVKWAITSHALEENTAAYLMFEHLEHRQHLRRRSYGRRIG